VALQVYKSGQGRYVRVSTAIGMALVDAVLSFWLFRALEREVASTFPLKVALMYGLPAILLVGLGLLAAYWLNKPVLVDFLIATESEMKKVSWSSRPELVGSTIVVIVLVFALADMIFLLDYLITALVAEGLSISWARQGWGERTYTALHMAVVLAAVSLLVRHYLERRMLVSGRVGQPGSAGPAAAALLVGAGWCYLWLVTGFRIPGLGLW
jgi:preprotein translocase SecE subunit